MSTDIGASCTSIGGWTRCSSTLPTIISRATVVRGNQDSVIYRSFSPTSTETTPVSPSEDSVRSSDSSISAPNSSSSVDSTDTTSNSKRQPSRKKSELESPLFALPPLTDEEYHPRKMVDNLYIAAKWNQFKYERNRTRNRDNWDYEFVRLTVDDYERHLRYILDHITKQKAEGNSSSSDGQKSGEDKSSSSSFADLLSNIHSSPHHCNDTHLLLAPQTLANAVRAIRRCKMDTPLLSQRIRELERLVGLIGWTPITEELSYRLLETNGKAGNVRRTLALLELRRRRGYVPRDQKLWIDFLEKGNTVTSPEGGIGIERGEKEFIHAITSIKAAQLPLRRARNIYLHESAFAESALDNPTRYLDAILLNMSQRGVPLRPQMASQMLACYASTGRTARALHYFYKMKRDPIEEDGYYIPGPHPLHLGKEKYDEWKEERRREGAGRVLVSSAFDDEKEEEDSTAAADDDGGSITMKILHDGNPQREANDNTKPRMVMHPPPPFHKVPSRVKGTHLAQGDGEYRKSFISAPTKKDSQQESASSAAETKTKYEWETSREWSLSLTAAFAFADSLTHGACGHDPIELDVGGWNCLIKACCYRGAFHRALKIIEETMPQKGVEPDVVSYNTILAGLARVGDVASLKEILIDMTNKNVGVSKYTVQAVADGFLNVGDISGASSLVQDVFNQHDTLPPYTTHLKIIEFALANGLVFEAKRHVYFIQQLWKWVPSKHHSKRFCMEVELTKLNPKLSKEALQRLFWYFREELNDSDFF